MAEFERELKRQENRHRMDGFDSVQIKKMDEEKKEGTDQCTEAKNQPAGYVQPKVVEGGCTIGETGKYLFIVGFTAIIYFGVQWMRK